MAWSESSVGDYFVGTESVTIPDPGGASEASINTSNLGLDPSNQKFMVYMSVTEASAADGAAEVRLQASPDDSNWVTVDTTTTMSVDTTSTSSSAAALVDATDTYAPYWRIQVFTDGSDIQDTADVTVGYAGIHLAKSVLQVS